MAQEAAVVVLEESLLQAYKHSDEEIEEYARYIGIDTEYDRDLLWIALAGLKSPLPAPWKPCQTTDSNDLFYFNFETGESVWDHPCDDFYREMVAKHLEKRVTVAITLSAEPRKEATAIVATNLAGNRLAEVEVADCSAESFGAVVQTQLMASLALAKGTAARFLLQDASMLGHSAHCKSVAQVFGLEEEQCSSSEAGTAQESKVVVLVSATGSSPMHVSCTRLDGELLCRLAVEDSSVSFKSLERRLRATVRLCPGESPRFVREDGLCLYGPKRQQSVAEVFGCTSVETRLVVVRAGALGSAARIQCLDCQGQQLVEVETPLRASWRATEKLLLQLLATRSSSSSWKFARGDGCFLRGEDQKRKVADLFSLPDAAAAPDASRLHDFALAIGMDLKADKDLLWIAEQAMHAPLPAGWQSQRKQAKKADRETLIYFNQKSGEYSWEHPCTQMFRTLYEQERSKKTSR